MFQVCTIDPIDSIGSIDPIYRNSSSEKIIIPQGISICCRSLVFLIRKTGRGAFFNCFQRLPRHTPRNAQPCNTNLLTFIDIFYFIFVDLWNPGLIPLVPGRDSVHILGIYTSVAATWSLSMQNRRSTKKKF